MSTHERLIFKDPRTFSTKTNNKLTRSFNFRFQYTYIYIRLKIKPNSVRIRFQSCKIFVLPSTGFEPTPLMHCSTIRLALRPAPQTTRPHPLPYIYDIITLNTSKSDDYVDRIQLSHLTPRYMYICKFIVYQSLWSLSYFS